MKKGVWKKLKDGDKIYQTRRAIRRFAKTVKKHYPFISIVVEDKCLGISTYIDYKDDDGRLRRHFYSSEFDPTHPRPKDSINKWFLYHLREVWSSARKVAGVDIDAYGKKRRYKLLPITPTTPTIECEVNLI